MVTTDHLMIDRRILLEARTLIEAGYEVRLLAGFECPEPAEYDFDGLHIHRYTYDWSDRRIDRFLGSLSFGSQRLHKLLGRVGRRGLSSLTGFSGFDHYVLEKILRFDFDILHCHDFPLLKVAAAAVKRRPARFVYDAHELYHAQSQLPPAVQQRYRRLEKRLIGIPDLVITVNPYIADIMARDYGIEKPAVILNATHVEPVPARDRLRAMTGIAPADRIVMYQGWMSPERGIERLVRCAAGFPPSIHLVLVGYGDFEAELKEISRAQGTDDGRVVFLGPLPNSDLAEVTPFADIGAIPYHGVDLNNYYCSPNKLFEFIAAGVPFVCNDLPFLRSVAGQYGCGVTVDFADPSAAARTITAILSDSARLDEVRSAARLASDTLNWNVEGGKLLVLYSSL